MIIGYTNGYWDMFHVGHLALLERAASMCDLLIVGVLTDDVCQRQKNRYCVIPLEQRMEIVKALPFVDMVVPCFEDDKAYHWEMYQYNKLFVGSDHKGTPVWEKWERIFKDLGVTIMYLPYTQGITSTLIKEKVLREKTYQEKTTLSQEMQCPDSQAPQH